MPKRLMTLLNVVNVKCNRSDCFGREN